MAKKMDVKFLLLAIVFTLALWILKDIFGMMSKVFGFFNELFVFLLCVGTALYLADKFRW